MSASFPGSSFGQFEDGTTVGLAHTMFFEATEDYLAAIQEGLSVVRGRQAQACQNISRKAEVMGSSAQMLAVKLHEDNPGTAVGKVADAIFGNDCIQFTVIDPLLGISTMPTPRETLFGHVQTILSKEMRDNDEITIQEALSRATRKVVLLKTRAWIGALFEYGITDRN